MLLDTVWVVQTNKGIVKQSYGTEEGAQKAAARLGGAALEISLPVPYGAVTVGKGEELHDYSRERRVLSLREQASSLWASWQAQQRALGNFEEAELAPPRSVLEALEGPREPEQLRLPGL